MKRKDYSIKGQLTLSDLGLWFGKTCQELSVQTKEKTLDVSSKKRQKWSKGMPAFLDLRTENGHIPDVSWEMGGQLLGDYTMHSFGECPKEENESRLSQILQEGALQKYYLSARACQGILRRAEKRGKTLPPMLKAALEKQSHSEKKDGKVGAIRANAGDNQQAIVVNNDPTYCIQGNCIDRADTAGCNGKGWREDASYTLNTIDRPAVVYRKKGHPQNAEQPQEWEKAKINDTINVSDNTDGRTPTLIVEGNVYDASRRHNYEPFNEVCETVQAHYGTGGGNVPIVRESYINETISMEVFHCTSEEEKVQTLKARDFKDPQVVYTIGHDERSAKFTTDEITDPLTSSDYKDPIKVSIPENNSIVRRLTPLECERLQGYPDGWTDIGEWVDSKGKKRKDSDSPRYKALGNSIALPFWQWMAHKMVKYIDGHQPTMASLFDGIGGFPLVFSRAGAKPIWASEIEEFPIAVTKIRFPEEEEETK